MLLLIGVGGSRNLVTLIVGDVIESDSFVSGISAEFDPMVNIEDCIHLQGNNM